MPKVAVYSIAKNEAIPLCSIKGCRSSAKRRVGTLCQMHYARHKRHGSFDPPRPERDPLCSLAGCENAHYALGWCKMHYGRAKSRGDRDPGPAHRLTARHGEGRWVIRGGYVGIGYDDNHKTILEHRAVMEATLGRALLPGENVHHINGVRDDNRPDNLELWVTYQPSGQRPADLVRWAREIETRYGAEIPR